MYMHRYVVKNVDTKYLCVYQRTSSSAVDLQDDMCVCDVLTVCLLLSWLPFQKPPNPQSGHFMLNG
jgi:hypothetical protein